MKITGTINFEFDDKDLKKRDVEVAGVVKGPIALLKRALAVLSC